MAKYSGKALVIGAGIAGLCSAYYLLESGWEVEVLERGDLRDNCSFGNAGMLVPSHFTPLAAPGVLGQGLRWLLDNKSPFYIRPSLSARMLRWGFQFMKHANQTHVENSAHALMDLNLASSALFNDLATKDDFDFDLHQNGISMLFKNNKTAKEEIELAHRAQQLGLEVDILDEAGIHALEPHLKLDVMGGIHYRCDGYLHPMKLMSQLIHYLRNRGVKIHLLHPVTDFEIVNGSISRVFSNGRGFTGDKIIMTGGSFLPELARKVSLRLHLMPGKGYSFTHQPTPQEGKLQHAALLIEARVAVTPMGGQIRFGGTMELGPHVDKININRVKGIVQAIPKYFPDMQVAVPDTSQIWYGYRPCPPDGLPYLGAVSKYPNLIVAGGGGMMGLSLGPILGHTVAAIAAEERPLVDINMFSPERFS
jgi:D-amino-acid dehydrogenase